jgi:hypothetical protein
MLRCFFSYFFSRAFLLFILLDPFCHALYSQNNTHKADSLKQKLEIDSSTLYRSKKIVPYINIDFRNAFVNNYFLSLAGLRAGYTINTFHSFGVGVYVLNEFSIFKSNKIKTYVFEEINYLTLFYEYKLFDGRDFDILLPFELGYGNYLATVTNDGSVIKSNIIPAGFGIKCILMPHTWVGIKFGTGYRFVWEEESYVGLDGVYFTVGIRIDLSHMIKDLRYRKLKKQYHRNIKAL